MGFSGIDRKRVVKIGTAWWVNGERRLMSPVLNMERGVIQDFVYILGGGL